MKKLVLIFALMVGASSILAADAANDVLLNQRNGANDDNVQQNVSATANALFAFNGSLAPISTLTPTGLTSLGVNSVTAATSTALTLAGGTSGASLVLGQGTTQVTTHTGKQVDSFNRATFSTVDSTALAAGIGGGISFGGVFTGSTATTWAGVFGNKLNATDGNYAAYLAFATRLNGANLSEKARLTDTGNLLIGTTTDATSLAGGLVINGSGTGAASSGTNTGALRVTGGVGVSGALNVGGGISSPGSGTASERFGASASTSTFTNATAVGSSSSVTGSFGTAIGNSSTAADSAVAIGLSASASSTYAIAIGRAASAANFNSVAIGAFTSAPSFGIAIGYSQTAAVGDIVLGIGNIAAEVYVGQGKTAAADYGTRIQPASGSGAGVLGGTLRIAGGKGGDAATAGGSVIIQTAAAGTGTTLTDRLTISPTGAATFAGAVSVASTTPSTGVGFGALQVAGGIYAGAASYFGGNISTAGTLYGVGNLVMMGDPSAAGANIYARPGASAYLRVDTGLGMRVEAGTLNVTTTTSASSSTVGALTIGNGTAATNVAIGGGNVNAGGTGTFGGAVTISKAAGGELIRVVSVGNTPYMTFTDGTYPLTIGVDSTAPGSAASFINSGSASGLRLMTNSTARLTLTDTAATFAGAVTGSTTISATTQFQSDTYRQLSGNRSLLSFTGVQTTVGSGATGDTTRIMANGVQALGFDTALVATFAGAVSLSTAGTTVSIKSGTNAAAGTVTLSGGSATITSTAIDVNTVIVMSVKTSGGTIGDHTPSVKVNAGNAVITGSSSDTSTYNWIALKVN
jgi:hypothetical protein